MGQMDRRDEGRTDGERQNSKCMKCTFGLHIDEYFKMPLAP